MPIAGGAQRGVITLEKGERVSKIRVLIVDDHAILREGVRSLLALQKDIEVVGEAVDGAAALRLVP